MTPVLQMPRASMVLITLHASVQPGSVESSVIWKLKSAIQILVRTMGHVLKGLMAITAPAYQDLTAHIVSII